MIDNNIIENKNLGEWSISIELLNFLINTLQKESTILEFGSGKGSIELSKFFNVWSIENNLNFLYKNTLQNIYAPIKTYKKKNFTTNKINKNYKWYDENIVLNVMKRIDYQCLIVDGPWGEIGREGFLHNLENFNTNCLIIIDDVNREQENKLLYDVSKKLGKEYSVYHTSDKKSFGVIDLRY